MSGIRDNCRHCELRGDMARCAATECYNHDNWYATALRAENERLREALLGLVDESDPETLRQMEQMLRKAGRIAEANACAALSGDAPTQPAPLPEAVMEAAERVRRAKQRLGEARMAERLAFNVARVPPDEGHVPQWEALPASLRIANEVSDERAGSLMAAVAELLAALSAAAKAKGEGGGK